MRNDESEHGDTRPAAADVASVPGTDGFLRRYRLPLFLGLVALCLYAGSIAYIIFIRVPTA